MTIRVCATPGCPELSTSTYCDRHTRRGRAHRSPTTRAQRDGTGDYDRNRALVLAGSPLCELRILCDGATADTVDHILPVASGGTHELSNLRPACRSCNSSRGARLATPGGRGPRATPAGGAVRQGHGSPHVRGLGV